MILEYSAGRRITRLNDTFRYDAYGNTTQSGNRHFTWTAFQKVQRMYKRNAQGHAVSGSSMEYDADFNRIVKKTDTGNANDVVETTYYVGTDYEYITTQGDITHRYTIATPGGGSIQVERQNNSDVDDTHYLLTDILGSTDVIVGTDGSIQQSPAFDAWGARINTRDTSPVNDTTKQGYTGHEQDDEMGLINMRARIYDPYIGRFLSADPIVPNAFDLQSLNRYAYVTNNPLKYVDPSGNSRLNANPFSSGYEGHRSGGSGSTL